MKRCVYLYFIILAVGYSTPAPTPQFPQFFGSGSNNTSTGGNNNGSSNADPGFFQGLNGFWNNVMSSIWGFLPIPGRPNLSPQSPTTADSVIGNTPLGKVPVALPIGSVTTGAGGSPKLMPHQSSETFDGNAILHLLQQQRQQEQQLQQKPPPAASNPPFPQGLSQNLQVVGSPSNLITIPGPGGTYQVISQAPTQNPSGYQILSTQSQPQTQTPTFQVVGPPQSNDQQSKQVTYQVLSPSQPQTLPQQTLLLPPLGKR